MVSSAAATASPPFRAWLVLLTLLVGAPVHADEETVPHPSDPATSEGEQEALPTPAPPLLVEGSMELGRYAPDSRGRRALAHLQRLGERDGRIEASAGLWVLPEPQGFTSVGSQWGPGSRVERRSKWLRQALQAGMNRPEPLRHPPSTYQEQGVGQGGPSVPEFCGYGVHRELFATPAPSAGMEVGMIEIVEDILEGVPDALRPAGLPSPLPLAIVEYVGWGNPDHAGQHYLIADEALEEDPAYRSLVHALLPPSFVHFGPLRVQSSHLPETNRSSVRAQLSLPPAFGFDELQLESSGPYRGRGIGGLADMLGLDHGAAAPHGQDNTSALINIGSMQMGSVDIAVELDGAPAPLMRTSGLELGGRLSQSVSLFREGGWFRLPDDADAFVWPLDQASPPRSWDEDNDGHPMAWRPLSDAFPVRIPDPSGLCTTYARFADPDAQELLEIRWESQGRQFHGSTWFAPALPDPTRPLTGAVEGAWLEQTEGYGDFRGRRDNAGTVELAGRYVATTDWADIEGEAALLSTVQLLPERPDGKAGQLRDVIIRTLTFSDGLQATWTSIAARIRHRSGATP